MASPCWQWKDSSVSQLWLLLSKMLLTVWRSTSGLLVHILFHGKTNASARMSLSRLHVTAVLWQWQGLLSSVLPGKNPEFRLGQAQPEGEYGYSSNVSSRALLSLIMQSHSVNYWARMVCPNRRWGGVSFHTCKCNKECFKSGLREEEANYSR